MVHATRAVVPDTDATHGPRVNGSGSVGSTNRTQYSTTAIARISITPATAASAMIQRRRVRSRVVRGAAAMGFSVAPGPAAAVGFGTLAAR